MEVIKEKRIEELVVGDMLMRKDKHEYVSVQGEYYFDSSPEKIYVLFEGYSVPKKYLFNFFKSDDFGKLRIYN